MFMTSLFLWAQNKAMGTDSISPKVLKHCADLLWVPIQHLFKTTLSNGYFPTEWHTYCITPIIKSEIEV